MTWVTGADRRGKNRNEGGIDAAHAAVPAGQRIYAIGDIHGRLDLLRPLVQAIEADATAEPETHSTVILLGDLIDRGPDSKGVLDFVRDWQRRRTVHILMGNHEEMFLTAFTDAEYLSALLPHGADETLRSYGIAVPDSVHDVGQETLQTIQSSMATRIPAADRQFMASFVPALTIGDYLFVHAGIEPDIPVAEQSHRAMRWIREPFLSHDEPYSHVVVHGHTIRPQVEERANRIGIDTGAYCYDVLTALVLEGSTRRFIQARGAQDAIAIETRMAAR